MRGKKLVTLRKIFIKFRNINQLFNLPYYKNNHQQHCREMHFQQYSLYQIGFGNVFCSFELIPKKKNYM